MSQIKDSKTGTEQREKEKDAAHAKRFDMTSSLKSSLTQTEEFTNYLARSTSVMGDSETIQDQESYLKSKYEKHSRTQRELKKLLVI